jgi:hypothetical protein
MSAIAIHRDRTLPTLIWKSKELRRCLVCLGLGLTLQINTDPVRRLSCERINLQVSNPGNSTLNNIGDYVDKMFGSLQGTDK